MDSRDLRSGPDSGGDLLAVYRLTEAEEPQNIIDVQATVRMLRRLHVNLRGLPSGLLAQRRKLREICETRGIAPVYRKDS